MENTPDKTFDSYEHLRQCIERQMPDMYPVGMAAVFADDLIKNNKVKIKNETTRIPNSKRKRWFGRRDGA